jgi:hypothetical protein
MSYDTTWHLPNDLWLRFERLLPPPEPTATPGRPVRPAAAGRQERQRAI